MKKIDIKNYLIKFLIIATRQTRLVRIFSDNISKFVEEDNQIMFSKINYYVINPNNINISLT